MAATSMLVTVVIPTYRRPDRLPALVAALEKQTLDRDLFEVVIVDNGSNDATSDVLADLAATSPVRLRPLVIQDNAGPAPARNLGWRSATTPLVAFLDDDCEPDPGWLAAGLAAIGRDERIGVVQGRVDRPEGWQSGDWTVFREIHDETPFFEACNIFYRREALEAGGGFDEGIGWYGEDTAAGWAVVAAGFERDYAHDAVVVHPLEERGIRWRIQNGYLECNLVALAARHPGLRLDAFWRPWAFRRENAAFAAAVLGAAAARRWRPAVFLALPYAWLRRPERSHRRPLRLLGERVVVDAAQAAGHLVGSVRHRILVL